MSFSTSFSIPALTLLASYVISLFSAVPTFIQEVQSKPDFSWLVTISETRDVTYDEYYEFYQENYKHMRDSDDYDHPERFKDVTAEYQALMDENLRIAQEWKLLPGKGQVNFYNAVKDNGVWDYKRPQNHAELAKEWGVEDKFTVYGCVFDWEIIGNTNFAFTGCVVGFTPTVIKTGGGIVSIKNNDTDLIETFPDYYDSREDAEWIDFGIKLYELMDPNYKSQAKTIDLFLTIADPRIFGAVYNVYKTQYA